MLAKLSAGLPVRHRPEDSLIVPRRDGDVVLVTGTTGSLGCHLLEALSLTPTVHRIYALNRASKDGTPLYVRQKAALIERAIDARILNLQKVVLIEGDLNHPTWGLTEGTFEEIVSTHADLTAPLPEAPRDKSIAETVVDISAATYSGYSMSKWIAENLLLAAANASGLDPLIVRVGQLSGGPGGAWAANEWFPLMVQSAPYLGCFTADPRPVDFLPFDVGAAALVDMLDASSPTHIAHLVHPRPTSWNAIAGPIAAALGVELVPFAEWHARLEAAPNVRELRARRLLPWFRGQALRMSSSPNAMGWPGMDTIYAVRASRTLADPALRQLGEEDETVYNAMHCTRTASEQVLVGNLGSMLHRQRSCASTIREQIEPTTLRVPTSHHVAYASCRLIPRYPDDITEIQGRLRCQHGA
ncbi:predicted protein [Postia placenta Mad-698-R]|nr:predicted protein [Postia placenta Mad-698-R]